MDMFPVILTTYEIVIRDRVHLAKYDWRYIIVDEGASRMKKVSLTLVQLLST